MARPLENSLFCHLSCFSYVAMLYPNALSPSPPEFYCFYYVVYKCSINTFLHFQFMYNYKWHRTLILYFPYFSMFWKSCVSYWCFWSLRPKQSCLGAIRPCLIGAAARTLHPGCPSLVVRMSSSSRVHAAPASSTNRASLPPSVVMVREEEERLWGWHVGFARKWEYESNFYKEND
jgi:hypothetical protein